MRDRSSSGARDMAGVPSRDRDVAMVFQNYALYPSKTVAENMGFALRMRGIGEEESARRVREAARLLDLEPLLDRTPRTMDGGQRQRVALGRAIVREPKVFCMDEPLSNLDAGLRMQTQAQISELQRRLRVTTVYVTHDQAEAMSMGERVAVLREGRLQQFAVPAELYERPANVFVASFIGSPAMNLAARPGDPQRGRHVPPQPRGPGRVGGQAAVPGRHVTGVEVQQRQPHPPASRQARQQRGLLVPRPPQLHGTEAGPGGPLELHGKGQAAP